MEATLSSTLEWLLPISMFITLLAFLMLGFPVAFTLGGTAIGFGFIGYYFDIFYIEDFTFIPSKIFGIISNFTLLAVPLFVFMGMVFEKSGLAEELMNTMDRICSKIQGGLTISLMLVGAMLAASTGIVGATVVTMGVLALPSLQKRGYDKQLSCGTVATAGTLGQIIPPSILLVLLGDIMNIDVGDLFIAAILPGLLLVALYITYIYIRVRLNPKLAPPYTPAKDQQSKQTGLLLEALKTILPPLLLMCIVLGAILGGIASPTEAAACGAVGASILALLRRKLTIATLQEISQKTVELSAMVFTLLIGAQIFSVVFRGLYGDQLISDFILNLEVSKAWILVVLMLLLFVLGFFLDFIEICFIILPIITPILYQLGFDPLWLAIIIAVNLQTSFLTPPFGFALFYLKGVAPKGITTGDIYKGVIPFVALQLLSLLILALFPAIVTWLPTVVFH